MRRTFKLTSRLLSLTIHSSDRSSARPRGLVRAAVVLAVLTASASAAAPPHPCGTSDRTVRPPTTLDALFVLRAAVGFAGNCGVCLCDVDSSGSVSVTDALLVLRRAVGSIQELHCPACPCTALTRLPTGLNPSSVVAADMDNDGHVDLVTADLKSDQVSIFSGSGRGRLALTAVVPTGQTPQSVTAADLNGDGRIDLVTSDALPNQVTVLLANAGGGFDAGVAYAAGEAPINSVAADVNGDAHLDLVVANSLSDDISVLLGDGSGAFAAEQRYAVGAGPRWVSLAHVDGDQALDAITANRDSDDLSVLHGDGSGGFGGEERLAVADQPYHVSTGDLDGNGKLDLVVPCTGASAVAVLLANDDGFAAAVLYPAGGQAIATDVALVDDDDILDIVAASFEGDGVPAAAVFLGNGDGTFAEAKPFEGGGRSRALEVADIDEDGTADIVLANAGSDDLSILHGIGNGSFVGRFLSQATARTENLTVAELSGDAYDDVATVGYENQVVTVSLSDGANSFDRMTYPVGAPAYAIAPARLNEDDATDLVAFAYSADNTSLLQQAHALLNDGAGGFEVAAEPTAITGADSFSDVGTGDIDGDGVTDLAVGDTNIRLLLGQGDGTFQSFVAIPAAAPFPAVEIADVNGDGRGDVIELVRGEDRLRVHRNKGDGTFRAPQEYPSSGDTLLATHDINGDGRVDLVATDNLLVSVHLNDGRGAFLPERPSALRNSITRFVLDDFDGDRAADLAVLEYDGNVLVYQGDALGRFRTGPLASVRLNAGVASSALGSGHFDPSPMPSIVMAARTGNGKNSLAVLRDVGNCLAP